MREKNSRGGAEGRRGRRLQSIAIECSRGLAKPGGMAAARQDWDETNFERVNKQQAEE